MRSDAETQPPELPHKGWEKGMTTTAVTALSHGPMERRMSECTSRKDKAGAKVSEQTLVYLSPRDLAVRWRCSRSTVDRIVEREGLTRLCLGEGQNGIIRYLLAEVEELEESRLLKSQTVS